jgi:hypothetical protein
MINYYNNTEIQKYLTYKSKYLELKNSQYGGGNNDIINFLKTAKKDKIKDELYDMIQNKEYCPKILGEGRFGKVYFPEVNKTMLYKNGKSELYLPIVIKDTLDNPDGYFNIDIINKTLYINGFNNITTEVIILMFIRNIYNKTVHLPLLLGYATCSKLNVVDKIITFKFGLDEKYEKNVSGKVYNEKPMFMKPRREKAKIFSSYLTNVKELIEYIYYNKNKDGTIKLPNGIICNISELFDYISISYLVTHHLLVENNVFPSDMHSQNIFIHWLNDNSYYKDKKIKNITEIVYKINKKLYKIKTFGFVIILGDLGMSLIKIRKDVILVGQIWDIKKNYGLIERCMRPEYNCIDFIKETSMMLAFDEYKNTIAYRILSDKPYSQYPQEQWYLLGLLTDYLDKLKPSLKLLEYYDKKYGIDKYIEHKNNILIVI